eukprot:m.615366 g.615366  ORF g.615366 m.615366 type:complete len:81 (-) comp58162_c0_seq1:52-294(-)
MRVVLTVAVCGASQECVSATFMLLRVLRVLAEASPHSSARNTASPKCATIFCVVSVSIDFAPWCRGQSACCCGCVVHGAW